MNLKKTMVFAGMCLLMAPPTLAADPATDRYAGRCQRQAPSRDRSTQGTLLWGARQRWDTRAPAKETSSVLVAVDLGQVARAGPGVKALELKGGRLVAPAGSVTDAVLLGIDSDGQPVEVAICGAEPSPDDPGMVWYQIEAWNPVARDWENPCVAIGQVPNPRALAVGGIWDANGAHHEVKEKVTFACENGVISKCARWGYKPWAADRGGHSMLEMHQACTRMARADYCGNGKSHTREATLIEYYDSAGVSSRAMEATPAWDPARASFEAAWGPDGASCLARTRGGGPLSAILQECPGRFQKVEVDLGDGDRCVVQRSGADAKAALLRNRVRTP